MARDYQSSLTGPQMDQALLDMANHTSERYAKGTAEGQAVAPGTTGYEDNAKYYKDQAAAQVDLAAGQVRLAELQVGAAAAQVDLAENAAQRAESAVPAGTDSAVLFTRDQSSELTAQQKAIARKNIMAGGTNPNLFDNPWFTVNQRGVNGSVANAAYGLDRWRYVSNGGGFCSMQTGQITIVQRLSSIEQRIETNVLDAVVNKALTASIMFADGTVEAGTATMPSSYTNGQMVMGLILGNAELRLYYGTTYCYLRIFPLDTSGTITIKAVKLEIGSVSTLANDAPPDFAEELAKCQMYFKRIKCAGGTAIFIAGDTAVSAASIFMTLKTNLRDAPVAVAFSGAALNDHAANYNISAMTLSGYGSGYVRLTCTASGLTTGKYYKLTLTPNNYIDLSTEI